MPAFVRNDGREVFVEAARFVFLRGVRISEPTRRRMRDVVYVLLHAMGASPREITGLKGVCPRQVRNIRAATYYLRTVDEAIARAAVAITVRAKGWENRVRDSMVMVLHNLGMDAEDVSATLRFNRSHRTVARRIQGLPPKAVSSIALTAHRTLINVAPKVARERQEREAELREQEPRSMETRRRYLADQKNRRRQEQKRLGIVA